MGTPRPSPPGAANPPDVPPEETLDYISGHFRLFQLRDGHRFSTDDVLTAWYGTSWCPTASAMLDLGSGIGSVATIAAWRLPGARLVTVEAQEISVALARKSARFNGLEERVRHPARGLSRCRRTRRTRTVRPRAGQPAVFPGRQRHRGRPPAEDRVPFRVARRHRRLLSRGRRGTWRPAASSRACSRCRTASTRACSRRRRPPPAWPSSACAPSSSGRRAPRCSGCSA